MTNPTGIDLYPRKDPQRAEPNEWESVLSGARGTIYRGTERISSNRLLDLLGRG